MLKGIPKVIDGELLKALSDMGHGDCIAIVDANYPARFLGKNGYVISYPGIGGTELVEAIMKLFPLDHIVDCPVEVMAMEKKDIDNGEPAPEFWSDIYKIMDSYLPFETKRYKKISRNDFYQRSREAFVIVQTGEERLYGNVILKKGVIK